MEDACYVGDKIRKVRVALGMKQTELGAKMGLNGDRIQKYENGARKPKLEMRKQFADSLEVNERYFMLCPPSNNYEDIMFSLFDIEENTEVDISMCDDGRAMLVFNDLGLSEEMKRWQKAKQWLDGDNEYILWKSRYSCSVSPREGQVILLREKLAAISKELSELESEEKENLLKEKENLEKRLGKITDLLGQ